LSRETNCEERQRREDGFVIRKIETDRAPAAIGPYSQGMIADKLLFSSGQIALDPATDEVVEGAIEVQARQVMKNVGAILEEAGCDYGKVVKTTCYLADMGDFSAFNEIYAEYFVGRPARSCVAVKTLPKNVLCEVEVIAYLGE
jgi:2-iminobutanoate/2-iminopropanoate deaminase